MIRYLTESLIFWCLIQLVRLLALSFPAFLCDRAFTYILMLSAYYRTNFYINKMFSTKKEKTICLENLKKFVYKAAGFPLIFTGPTLSPVSRLCLLWDPSQYGNWKIIISFKKERTRWRCLPSHSASNDRMIFSPQYLRYQ